MKILTVDTHPGCAFVAWVNVTALIFGKEVMIEGPSIQIVAKKAMKLEDYFTRDTEIIEDINRVIQEQELSVGQGRQIAQTVA